MLRSCWGSGVAGQIDGRVAYAWVCFACRQSKLDAASAVRAPATGSLVMAKDKGARTPAESDTRESDRRHAEGRRQQAERGREDAEHGREAAAKQQDEQETGRVASEEER